MGDEYLRAGREIARLLHERGEIEDAKNALSEAASKYPASVGSEDVNLLLELLLALGGFHEALEVLCQHGKLQFASERSPEELASMDPEQQLGEFSSVLLPEGEEAAPLDIVSKMIVVLVNLKADHLVTVKECVKLNYQLLHSRVFNSRSRTPTGCWRPTPTTAATFFSTSPKAS